MPTIAMADLASKPSDLTLENKFERFEAWLKENGAKFDLLELREYAEVRSDDDDEVEENRERGVHAKEDIEEGTMIMLVPLQCLITVDMGRAIPIGKKIDEANLDLHAPRHIFLMLYILWDRKVNGESSFFHPYYEILPQSFDKHPIFWTDDELENLKGSFLLAEIADRIEAIEEDYRDCCGVAPELSEICTLEEFKWARVCVTSRNFAFEMDQAWKRVSAMVPHADMLNHRRPCETRWTYDDDLHGFTITALKNIPAGGQVYDSYGMKSNHRFLLNYGFSLEKNIEEDGTCPDEVIMTITMNHDDPIYEKKMAFWVNEEDLVESEVGDDHDDDTEGSYIDSLAIANQEAHDNEDYKDTMKGDEQDDGSQRLVHDIESVKTKEDDSESDRDSDGGSERDSYGESYLESEDDDGPCCDEDSTGASEGTGGTDITDNEQGYMERLVSGLGVNSGEGLGSYVDSFVDGFDRKKEEISAKTEELVMDTIPATTGERVVGEYVAHVVGRVEGMVDRIGGQGEFFVDDTMDDQQELVLTETETEDSGDSGGSGHSDEYGEIEENETGDSEYTGDTEGSGQTDVYGEIEENATIDSEYPGNTRGTGQTNTGYTGDSRGTGRSSYHGEIEESGTGESGHTGETRGTRQSSNYAEIEENETGDSGYTGGTTGTGLTDEYGEIEESGTGLTEGTGYTGSLATGESEETYEEGIEYDEEDHQKTVRISMLSSNEDNNLLFSLLRVLASTEDELAGMQGELGDDHTSYGNAEEVNWPISVRNEKAAMHLLLDLITQAQNNYPSTLEQDEDDLQDTDSYPLFSNRRNAKMQVLSEKRVLRNFYSWGQTALKVINVIELEEKGGASFKEVIDALEEEKETPNIVVRYCNDVLGTLRQVNEIEVDVTELIDEDAKRDGVEREKDSREFLYKHA